MTGITVVIPVWDRYGQWLPMAVASARSQDGVRCTVIVVDNASDAELPSLPDDVCVIRTAERVTAGQARNVGLDHVQTEFVSFLDADDLLVPHALARLTAAVRDDATIAAAAFSSWENHYLETGAVVLRRPAFWRPTPLLSRRGQRLFRAVCVARGLYRSLGAVCRTEAVRAVGGFGDLNIGETWILEAKLLLRYRCIQLPGVGSQRRIHTGSLNYRHIPPAEIAGWRASMDDVIAEHARSRFGLMLTKAYVSHLHSRYERHVRRRQSHGNPLYADGRSDEQQAARLARREA